MRSCNIVLRTRYLFCLWVLWQMTCGMEPDFLGSSSRSSAYYMASRCPEVLLFAGCKEYDSTYPPSWLSAQVPSTEYNGAVGSRRPFFQPQSLLPLFFIWPFPADEFPLLAHRVSRQYELILILFPSVIFHQVWWGRREGRRGSAEFRINFGRRAWRSQVTC